MLVLLAAACGGGSGSDPAAPTTTRASVDVTTPADDAGEPTDDGPFTVWSYDGLVLTPATVGAQPGAPTADPSAVVTDDGVRVYLMVPGVGLRSLFAADGMHFELEDGVRYPQPPANPAQVVALPEGGYRAYHHDGAGDIVSARSDDGLTFELEEGVRMRASDYARPDDVPTALFMPAVVVLPDGSWRAWMPSAPGEGQYVPFVTWSATSTDGLTWEPDPAVRLGDVAAGPEGDVSLRHVRVEGDGTLTGWLFRDFRIWEMRSADGGATWDDAEPVGIPGNDPSVFDAPDGHRRMLFGTFDAQIGGVVGLATRTEATWVLRRDRALLEETVATVHGATSEELQIDAYDLARDEVVPPGDPRGTIEVDGELPNLTITLRRSAGPGPIGAVVIRVTDGTVTQIA